MNAVALVTKVASAFAGCVMLMMAVNVQADYYEPVAGRYDMHGLGNVNSNAIPLFTVQLSASTDLMKGNAMDFIASYRSVGVNQDTANLNYNVLSTEFSLNAPRVKSLDFSKAIREKVEICPEKLIDKLVIDGAVSLNYQW